MSHRYSHDAMLEYMKGVLDETTGTNTLKWSSKNRKLDDIPSLSLPAGHSCPFAKDCESCAVQNPNFGKDTGRLLHGKKVKRDDRHFIIQNGPETQFRCYAAIDEVIKPTARRARWHNYILLQRAMKKGKAAVVKLIEKSLPKLGKFSNPPYRIHTSGDFFRLVYFDAWIEVARRHPNQIFYCYTKALPFWVMRLKKIPANFRLTASRGGTHDWMIEKYNLRSAVVVFSPEEAKKIGLELDHDDSHTYGTGGDFALLVHGQQPAGTEASKAWSELKKRGMGGYHKHKDTLISALRKS